MERIVVHAFSVDFYSMNSMIERMWWTNTHNNTHTLRHTIG